MKLTANQALQLIENFRGKNENDRWIDHCVSVGNTAGKIAGALKDKSYNIDVDKTIALGYVHDIGKYTDKTHKHDIKGYEYLIGKGYDEDYCNICLTHSYLNNDITCTAGGVPDITENPFLTNFVKNHEYTIEEKIISTADAISHIEYPVPLFYTWYGKRKSTLEAGAIEIRNKLQRSWNKIEFEYKKDEIKEKYNYLMEVLSNNE